MRPVLLVAAFSLAACVRRPPAPGGAPVAAPQYTAAPAAVPDAPPDAAVSSPLCVADLGADAVGRVHQTPNGIGPLAASEARVEDVDDLDGDGAIDHVVLFDRLTSPDGNTTLAVYLSSSGCWRFAGYVDGMQASGGDGVHQGVRDVVVFGRAGGACPGGGSFDTWSWTGETFELVARDPVPCDE